MPTAPTTWKDAITLNTNTTGTQSNPSVAQLNDGSFAAVWIDEQTDTIRYQFLDIFGEPVGGEGQILGTSPNAGYTSVEAYDLPGNSFGVIIGVENDTAGYALRQVHLSNQGSIFFSQTLVTSAATATLVDTTTVKFSDTSAMIFWINEDATGEMAVRGRPVNPQTGTLGTAFDVVTTTTNDFYNLAAVALDNGNFALSYINDVGTADRLQTRVVDASGSPVGPSNFVTNGGLTFGDTNMTALDNGNFAVLYDIDEGAASPTIRANVYSAANAPLLSTAVVAGSDGAIANLPGGEYVKAFLDDTNQSVTVGAFSSSGVPLNSNAVVTIDTGAGASGVDLFQTADGRFIVTWQDAAGDVRAEIVDVRSTDASIGNSPVQVGLQSGSTFTTDDVAYFFAMYGNDVITENTGSTLTGRLFDLGDGSDQMVPTADFADGNRYEGGTGTDSIDFDQLPASVGGITVDLAAGTATSLANPNLSITIDSFENAQGTNSDDTLLGDAGANTLSGAGGNDTLNGGNGADRLFGISGNNLLLGNAGNDLLTAGSNASELRGGIGNDILTGSTEADTLIGGAGDDTLTGGVGADILRGSSGIDTINGGDGDDAIFGGAGDDIIDTGAGNDEVRSGAGNDDVTGLDGNDTLFGMGGNDRMEGNQGTDTLFGGAGVDTLFGSDGNDTLFGGAEGDTLDGMNDSDIVRGQGGDDIVNGGNGDDDLFGGGGNDRLFGGDGNDDMFGGAGADELRGGDGNDTFTGQAGADEFIIGFTDGGTNTVTDFDNSEGDTVLLTGFSFQTAQDAASSFAQSGSDVVFTNGNDTFTFENALLADVRSAVVIDTNMEAAPRTAPTDDIVAPTDPDAEYISWLEDGFDFG